MQPSHRTRTPEQHRTEVAWIWAQWAPANDSDIFGSRSRTSPPRHAKLADALDPVRDWQRLKTGPADARAETWLAVNDNLADVGCSRSAAPVERKMEIRPQVEEMLQGVDAKHRPDADRAGHFRIGRLLFDGACRLVTWEDEKGRERRPVDRLRASFGSTQTEAPQAPTTGRRLRADDFRDAPTATEHFDYAPWLYFSPKPVPAALRELHERFGGAVPIDEARDRAGLPPAAANDNVATVPTTYLSGRCTGAPSGNPPRQYNALDQIIDAEAAAMARAQMAADDVSALEAVMPAENFADVGSAFGYTGKTAERQGKARLLKASASFATFLTAQAA